MRKAGQSKTPGDESTKCRFSTLLEISLLSLEVQRELVAEVEGYQRAIDNARMEIYNKEQHIQTAVSQLR